MQCVRLLKSIGHSLLLAKWAGAARTDELFARKMTDEKAEDTPAENRRRFALLHWLSDIYFGNFGYAQKRKCMSFEKLQLIAPLLRTVRGQGYTTPTPIQERAIPAVMEGKDLMGCAQTGTGKTAAFALPIIQNLLQAPRSKGRRPIRVLVVTPTRELAVQVANSFATYGRNTPLRHVVIYGGVGQVPQVKALQRGVDIVVATPGRLLDLVGQGHVHLNKVENLVLDEADRMLDMGFIPDIRRIVEKLPSQRQTLMFSATMPREIRRLADTLLTDPVSISVAPTATPAERIDQSLYYVEKSNKTGLLLHLLENHPMQRLLVFTRTKHGADKVVRTLNKSRFSARAIHGNKSQNQRQQALKQFRQGHARVLVATDIASRGLDIDNITHVINYDLPNESESYVHRIGRTARAGASGKAIAFCSSEEHSNLRDIEKLIRCSINIVSEHPYHVEPPAAPQRAPKGRRNGRPQRRKNQAPKRFSGNRSQSRDEESKDSFKDDRGPRRNNRKRRSVSPRSGARRSGARHQRSSAPARMLERLGEI
jgi:ATP-dependent RNA helicase RhlE